MNNKIFINGQEQILTEPKSLLVLLNELNISTKSVVVELNLEALSPSEFSGVKINPGDKLEIVKAIAGG